MDGQVVLYKRKFPFPMIKSTEMQYKPDNNDFNLSKCSSCISLRKELIYIVNNAGIYDRVLLLVVIIIIMVITICGVFCSRKKKQLLDL